MGGGGAGEGGGSCRGRPGFLANGDQRARIAEGGWKTGSIGEGYQGSDYFEALLNLGLCYQISRTLDPTHAPLYAAKGADVLAKMKMLSIKETKLKFPASPDASIQEVASSGDLEYKDNQGQQQFGSFEVQERWQRVDDRWMLVRLVSRLSD